MASRSLGLAASAGLALLVLATLPTVLQAADGQAISPPCPDSGTYMADIDGAPYKGACRPSIEQLPPESFNIPPGTLFDGLKAYFEQSGARGLVPLDILMANICTRGSNCAKGAIPTDGVTGTMSPREALDKLLAGTGVAYVQDQTGTLHFPPAKDAAAPGGRCLWDKSPWKGCV